MEALNPPIASGEGTYSAQELPKFNALKPNLLEGVTLRVGASIQLQAVKSNAIKAPGNEKPTSCMSNAETKPTVKPSWRVFCVERGIPIPALPEPVPVPIASRVHIIPSLRMRGK
jgi:hypothetical protein